MLKHVVLIGAVLAGVWSQAAPKPSAMTAAEKLGTVRVIAAAMPGKALQDWMTKGAYNRWQTVYGGMVAPDESSPMVADFFSHALLLAGRGDAQSGVYAFYNPLQDNILLIQTDNQDTVPRIEDFVFMTGTEFRGGKLGEKEYPRAVAPVGGDLDAVLVGNVAEVARVFHAAFPAGDKGAPSLGRFRKFAGSADKVAANAALRLALLERFTRDDAQPDALKAAELAELLWKGDVSALKAAFVFPAADAAGAELYASLPNRVKASMAPALYFRDKAGTVLFGFASHLMPEVLVLVKIPADGKPGFVFLPLAEKFAAAE